MAINTFEELECWKACKVLKDDLSIILKTLPSFEKYDMVDNMRRAARSTTRNIAEGFGRHHHKENMQFCRISRGSLFEIMDDLITIKDEGYIDEAKFMELKGKTEGALKILNGYLRYLNSITKQ